MPGAFRQFAHGRQALPGRQFAQGNPELDQPAQLRAERHRKRTVERPCEARENALIGRLFRVAITDAFISVRSMV